MIGVKDYPLLLCFICLGDFRWKQFRYVRMNLFVQIRSPLLVHYSFNDSALVKRLGRAEYAPNERIA